jgi:hypothetical protein
MREPTMKYATLFAVASAITAAIVGCQHESAQRPNESSEKVPVEQQTTSMSEHLVRVHLPLGASMPTSDEFDRWSALEDILDNAARKAGVGYLDGNEVGGGEYTIWLYGRDGARLAEVVRDALGRHNLPPGCKLFVRYGGVDDSSAREETIPL